MQRITISIDDELAQEFDRLIAAKGYVNRSEAVRDLIRDRLGNALLATGSAKWCVASVSFVYDHHDHALTRRMMDLQHEHHDIVVSSLHTHLDHANCLETVILRGPSRAVQACAGEMVALRGVRQGNIHAVALLEETRSHRHDGLPPHRHLSPGV